MKNKVDIFNQKEFANRNLLPKEVKKRWLEALKSNNYSKGKSELCFKNNYCCLGVLCEIENFPKQQTEEHTLYYNTQAVFPTDAIDLFKILGTLGHFKGFRVLFENHHYDNLANLNDNTETFEQVIEVIEKYF